jgi:hypothetical protein
MGGIPVSKQYMDWYITQLRAREQAEETARRLATDFLVFISYSWADEAVARAVTDVLQRRGVRYVQDRKDISWGEGISDWADQEITRCTHYLLILSKTSAASHWCAYEYGVAVGGQKEMLVFVVTPELDIPAFAAGRAAVRELRDVESFFAAARIDESEVERFIEEMLSLTLQDVAAFVPRKKGVHSGWDAPDRSEREARTEAISGHLGGVDLDGTPRTLGLDIDYEDARMVVDAKKHGYRTQTYEFTYVPALEAVRVIPEKDGSFPIGVQDDTGDLRPGSGTVVEALSGKRIYGWPASADFWTRTLKRLSDSLPTQEGDQP